MNNAPDRVGTGYDEFPLEREDISGFAIVGMACRFPGAKDTGEFWRNLRDGVESVVFFSEQEMNLRREGSYPCRKVMLSGHDHDEFFTLQGWDGVQVQVYPWADADMAKLAKALTC